METKSNAKLKALFIIPSITGIILFMIPVKNADGDWTVVVKILADIISADSSCLYFIRIQQSSCRCCAC